MSTRGHAFASMGRRAAALAACMALVAGLSPWAPASADEAASQAPAAQDTPAPASASEPAGMLTAQSASTAEAASGGAQEDPATAASEPAGTAAAQTASTVEAASSEVAAAPSAASEPLAAQSLTAQAGVGDVFTGKITVGGKQVDCEYRVLSLPVGTTPGTVQVGNGDWKHPAIATSASGALVIPATVDYDGGKYAVTALGSFCFYGCTGLTGTGLAGNSAVTSLGGYCFQGCTGLTDTGLAGNSAVTTMGYSCFGGCTGLVNAALGSGLTSMSGEIFESSYNIRTIYFAGPFVAKLGNPNSQGVVCYHLASDSTWTGKSAWEVCMIPSSLAALSRLAVSGGTYSGSPANPWSSVIDGETLWAEGEKVVVTASTTGYTFSGWSSSDVGGSFADAAARTTTYTFGPSAGSGTTTLAGATPITYKVSFDANGGSGAMANEDMAYDAAKALTSNAFSRAGYRFAGWNTTTDGKGTSYADGASVENLTAADGTTVTLYAQWAKDAGTVTAANTAATTTPSTGDGSALPALLLAAAGAALAAFAAGRRRRTGSHR